MTQAHAGHVVALAVSQDGKYLASYSHADSRLKFWQVGFVTSEITWVKKSSQILAGRFCDK